MRFTAAPQFEVGTQGGLVHPGERRWERLAHTGACQGLSSGLPRTLFLAGLESWFCSCVDRAVPSGQILLARLAQARMPTCSCSANDCMTHCARSWSSPTMPSQPFLSVWSGSLHSRFISRMPVYKHRMRNIAIIRSRTLHGLPCGALWMHGSDTHVRLGTISMCTLEKCMGRGL